MTEPAKRFDDAEMYERQIRHVLPGYDLLHSLTFAHLEAILPSAGRLLVVGCGTGHELVRAAAVLPEWSIEAVEKSAAMRFASRGRVNRSGLRRRVRVAPTFPAERSDAGLCLLVLHLIPDDGSREALWAELGNAIAPGGTLLTAEIESMDESTRSAWRGWSSEAGASAVKLEQLEHRLDGGFPLVDAARRNALAKEAGFALAGDYFRAFGVVASAWTKG
ncbi:MAG: class I SAM-dependent methyltransferase [Myxococcota bacterium]